MTNHLFLHAPLEPRDAVAAIIVIEDGRFLLQLRDDIEGIFYPGFWGLFGGAVEAGESAEEALIREVGEELSFEVTKPVYFTQVVFDFAYAGIGPLTRDFFIVNMPGNALPQLRLGEGKAMREFTPEQILSDMKIVPYDAFALWQYINRHQIWSGT